MTQGGASIPVYNNVSPLAVMGGPARPVEVVASGQIEGGSAVQLYELSASELAERGKSGGEPLRVSLAPGRMIQAGPAIPVYVTAGSLGGITPTPPVGYTEFSAWDAQNDGSGTLVSKAPAWWVTPTGMNTYVNQQSGLIYSSDFAGGDAGAMLNMPVPLVGSDMWAEANFISSWSSSSWTGIAVRMRAAAATCYVLWWNKDGWMLQRDIAGSRTTLDSGSQAPSYPSTTRLEAEGTRIRAYYNDVLLSSVVDANISDGDGIGYMGAGIASGNAFWRLRGGNLPIGNIPVYNNWAAVSINQNGYVNDFCGGAGFFPAFMNGALNVSATHNVDHVHYIEIDWEEFRIPLSMRTHGTTDSQHDWQNVTVKGKLEAGDAWTDLGTGLSFNNVGVDGWKYSDAFDTIMICRYMRIEVNSTAHASNWFSSEEIQFWCGKINDLTYLFLLRDDFTTADAAPINQPRNCEPGPGQFNFQDTNTVLSIANGKLTQTGLGASASDPGLRGIDDFARVAGRTLLMQNNGNGRPSQAWTDTSYSQKHGTYEHNRGYIVTAAGNVETPDTAGDTDHIWAIMLRDAGAIYLVKGGMYTDWTCIWVQDEDTTTPLRVASFQRDTTAETRDFVRVSDLPAPFNTDTGFATNYIASPGVGETTTSLANAHIKFHWTAATGETLEISFRRTDDDNRLICRCDQAGSTIKLIEEVATVENEVASAAATWTDGVEYEITIRTAATGIHLWTNPGFAAIKSGSSLFTSATGVKVSHAGSKLSTWPYNITGTLNQQLDKRTA